MAMFLGRLFHGASSVLELDCLPSRKGKTILNEAGLFFVVSAIQLHGEIGCERAVAWKGVRRMLLPGA